MSTTPQWERSDRPKVPRGMRERFQNKHRATAIANWQAQSDERVARAIWKWAPPHGSDPTRTKRWKGCASTSLKSQKRLFTQVSQCLQSIAPATQNGPDASKVLRLPHRIIIMSEIKFDNGFTKFSTDLKCRPSSPNTAHATKNSTSQFEQRTEKCHACCADEKVSDVLRLSRQTMFQTSKCPESATPATQNGHSSKNGDDALVKRDLRKRGLRDPVCARMRGRNAHGHLARELLCCKGHRIAGDHLEWTPGLNTYRENPAVGPHCLGNWINVCRSIRIYMDSYVFAK